MTHTECIHEELLKAHSLHIAKLAEKSKYKEQLIMELKSDVKEVNGKLDLIINKSKEADTELEKRVGTLETTIDLYKNFFEDKKDEDNNRTSHQLSTIAIMATITGIVVGVIIKFI